MSKPLKVIKAVPMTDSLLTATSVTEADHAAWNSGTTYALGDRVILVSTHKIYESLQASNTNKAPVTETLWWVEVEATNRWRLFDLSSTTVTTLADNDYYEVTTGQAVNTVGLMNIAGLSTVRIRLTDPDFGAVYDETTALDPVPLESTWYSWFFDPRVEVTQFVATDLPSYPNAVLRVDFETNSTATVGVLMFGTQRTVGFAVKQGVRLGIQDYSRKERNDFGESVLVQRAFATRIGLDLLVNNSDLDNTFKTLSGLRATPCLWVLTDLYSSLTVFGFFNNFEINIAYANYSDCSVDIESLT